MSINFKIHHCTVSVRNIEESSGFYSIFGFKLVLRWAASDGSLEIAHYLRSDGFLLEMFQYKANESLPFQDRAAGNDLDELGIKHIAFRVDNIRSVFEELRNMDCGKMTEILSGRTGIDYFFIADPDGNWVEVVQDDRELNTQHPHYLTSPGGN